jgi:quinol monooxygenase YgiN
MFIAIAKHFPHPDHVETFGDHMKRVVEATKQADGLVDFDCYRDEETGALLGVSRWTSRDAFEAALPLIGSCADRRRDEWTVEDDELTLLTEI